jgi:hypothetical protein
MYPIAASLLNLQEGRDGGEAGVSGELILSVKRIRLRIVCSGVGFSEYIMREVVNEIEENS